MAVKRGVKTLKQPVLAVSKTTEAPTGVHHRRSGVWTNGCGLRARMILGVCGNVPYAAGQVALEQGRVVSGHNLGHSLTTVRAVHLPARACQLSMEILVGRVPETELPTDLGGQRLVNFGVLFWTFFSYLFDRAADLSGQCFVDFGVFFGTFLPRLFDCPPLFGQRLLDLRVQWVRL